MIDKPGLIVLTTGHSTRTLDEFLELLIAYGVAEVVDIRTIPRSSHNPQFNIDTLPEALNLENIQYCHMTGLGGLQAGARRELNQR